MTKKEAVEEFKAHAMPWIQEQYEQDGRPDWPARREAWNNFTDMLQKEGRITMRQYETWTHPSITANPVNWLSTNPFQKPLLTSQNTKKAQREVEQAAMELLKVSPTGFDAFYEHGQWWVRTDDGEQECTYSAVDSTYGVEFEQIDCVEY